MAGRIGGQAVFEGVMMRGDRRWAVAVRRPDGGIEVLAAPLPRRAAGWRKVPLVRGLVALAEALPLGVRALRWSAAHGLGRSERRATPIERVGKALTFAGVLALVVTIPAYGARWLVGGVDDGLLTALVENVLAIGILLAYAGAAGRLGAVQRLFENHGAEHKVVAAAEAGVELTPARAEPFSARHVRCGTSLLLIVGAVSGAFSVLADLRALPGPLASGMVVVPLVAAIATELQLRAAANTQRAWVRALLRPGLALQRLTTREPSRQQLEVAIAAFRAAYGTEMASAAQPSSSVAVAVPA